MPLGSSAFDSRKSRFFFRGEVSGSYEGELFRLNIEAQKVLDDWGLNFFQEV